MDWFEAVKALKDGKTVVCGGRQFKLVEIMGSKYVVSRWEGETHSWGNPYENLINVKLNEKYEILEGE